MLALAVLAWRARPDGTLRVTFLDTSGDAALIQTPAGGYVLIDGGADPAALAAAIGRVMPFWRRTLDAVVLTGADAARLPGQVAALGRYHANLALVPPGAGRGAALDEWRRLTLAEQTPVRIARPGDQVSLGGANLRVLAIDDARGLLLWLEYGATSVVFDQSGVEDAPLERAARPVDLLAFPWEHDPRVPLVAALRPRAIVFTDGAQADQPAELTFAERAPAGTRLYHERLDGAITWASDGRRTWVATER